MPNFGMEFVRPIPQIDFSIKKYPKMNFFLPEVHHHVFIALNW